MQAPHPEPSLVISRVEALPSNWGPKGWVNVAPPLRLSNDQIGDGLDAAIGAYLQARTPFPAEPEVKAGPVSTVKIVRPVGRSPSQVLPRPPRCCSYDPSPGRYAGRTWEGAGMQELERITARRSELNVLAEELAKRLQEVRTWIVTLPQSQRHARGGIADSRRTHGCSARGCPP